MRRLTHATRRFILGVIIFLNTVLFGMSLFKDHNVHAAFMNFLVCSVCWLGIYFVGWAERLELGKKKETREEEKHDDDDDDGK